MSDTYKEESRRNWSRNGTVSNDDIKVGTLQRIADACEKMVEDRGLLERRAKWAEERLSEMVKTCDRLARSNAALRGVIKRTKRAAP